MPLYTQGLKTELTFPKLWSEEVQEAREEDFPSSRITKVISKERKIYLGKNKKHYTVQSK